MIYEIICKGFDGSTDATDDLILWVNAPDAESVRAMADRFEAKVSELESFWADDSCVDFVLPQDRDALERRLKELQ